MPSRYIIVVAALAVAGFSLAGCGSPSGPGASKVAQDSHSHDGWWCDEHGVPEEVCALCNVKLVADFKTKGDWCKKHERPDSQCFVCHPEREAEFAAEYEAKFGKKPPQPETATERPQAEKQEAKS